MNDNRRYVNHVMVSGSRSWTDRDAIFQAFSIWEEMTGAESICLIHGGAQGADLLAADVASRDLDWQVRMFPADWKTHGKRAGILRNLEMLDERPDHVFIFWDGKSRGTKHVIDEVQRRLMSYTIGRSDDVYAR